MSAPGGTMADVKKQVIVLANRAPFTLEQLLEAYSGTWVAHAAGSADMNVVDQLGRIDVPPANPQYRVRYVSVPDDEYRGYYYGFANEGIWPLCHTVDVPPVFRRRDF